MKKQILSVFALSILLINTSYAFCVYNQTVGHDSVVAGTRYPTQIFVRGEFYIDQNDYRCDRKEGERDDDAQTSLILSEVIDSHSHRGHHHASTQPICTINVFNKGGYVVVTGSSAVGFQCKVQRDPN